jgi:glycosyltransferase involved in cell wall biosynthesis
LKILFVLDGGCVGGSEKLAVTCAEKIQERGHRASVLILGKDRGISGFSNKVTFFVAKRRSKLDLYYFVREILRVISDYSPEVFVTNGLFGYFFISLSLTIRKLKIPVFHVFHSISPFSLKERLFDFFYAIALHFFNGTLIALYKDQIQDISRRYFLYSRKINLLPSGIDLDFYSRENIPFLPSGHNSSREDVFRIIHVARLLPMKDQETLFRGLSIFNNMTTRPWQLLIAGAGTQGALKKYKKILLDLNIYEKVIFLGMIKDLRPVLALADVFILTSLSEALPLSALEALSMGVPCILTKVGGCPNIVLDGVNGYLIPVRDPEAIAAKLSALSKAPELSVQMKINAKETAKRFDINYTIETYLALFKEKLNKVNAGKVC